MKAFPLPIVTSCGTYFSGISAENPEIRMVESFEIEYFTSDGAEFYLDDKRYRTRKGHILIAKPGQKRINYLPFSTIFLKVEATDILAQRLMSTPDYFFPAHAEDIEAKIKDIILIKQSLENEILFYGKLLTVIDRIIKDSQVNYIHTDPHDEIIKRAKKYIKENFDKPIRLKDIASVTHLSQTYFHKVFTAECMITPNDYLNECRINEAKKLLGFTTMTIGEISDRCGFCSQPYFNKIFKNSVGCSPSKYRKEITDKYL